MDGFIAMLPPALRRWSTHHDFEGQKLAEKIFQVSIFIWFFFIFMLLDDHDHRWSGRILRRELDSGIIIFDFSKKSKIKKKKKDSLATLACDLHCARRCGARRARRPASMALPLQTASRGGMAFIFNIFSLHF